MKIWTVYVDMGDWIKEWERLDTDTMIVENWDCGRLSEMDIICDRQLIPFHKEPEHFYDRDSWQYWYIYDGKTYKTYANQKD